MPTPVTLTITQGSLKGQEFIFDSRTTCIIGKGVIETDLVSFHSWEQALSSTVKLPALYLRNQDV